MVPFSRIVQGKGPRHIFQSGENGLRSLKFCGISCQRPMAANETIRLPVFVLIRNLYTEILFGSIPSIVMMYITGVLEEMVKDFGQDTFVPCICKFESMQPIYIIYC